MAWDSLARSLIRCGCGTAAGRLCRCRLNRFALVGGKVLQQTENSSRDRILERIRAGLRAPAPEPAETSPDRVIFESINNPLERFQQECAANLTERVLTADTMETTLQLAEVLPSLTEPEVLVDVRP